MSIVAHRHVSAIHPNPITRVRLSPPAGRLRAVASATHNILWLDIYLIHGPENGVLPHGTATYSGLVGFFNFPSNLMVVVVAAVPIYHNSLKISERFLKCKETKGEIAFIWEDNST